MEPNLVRPYRLTAGRTDTSVYLPLEAPIRALATAVRPRWSPADPRARILGLCGYKTGSIAAICSGDQSARSNSHTLVRNGP